MLGRYTFASLVVDKMIYDSKNSNTSERKRVETALAKYKADTGNCSAGYDIIRFANAKLLKVKWWAAPFWCNKLIKSYPTTQAYVLLRMAKAGHLVYDKQED